MQFELIVLTEERIENFIALIGSELSEGHTELRANANDRRDLDGQFSLSLFRLKDSEHKGTEA